MTSRLKLPVIFLTLCVLLMAFRVGMVSGAASEGGGDGGNVPPPHGGFGFPSGSFKLNRSIKSQGGVACAYYTDFLLVVDAGQQFKGRLWTSGATINYTIVSDTVFNSLQQTGCSYLSELSGQVESFNSPIVLSWTAPQSGQYELIFYSQTPYTGQIYCLPQS